MRTEVITLNEERNATLTCMIQDVGDPFRHIKKRPGIMIIPGGGYQYCSEQEAMPTAFAFLEAGYQTFILRYSVAEYSTWPNPLEDYEQAMGIIRARAEEWDLYGDKIAVAGFSAGGHLAACAATMAKERPNAAILGYAVTKAETAAECEKGAPDVVSAVDTHTCPCFVFATRDDAVVPVANSIELIQALAKNGVSFESHIYAYGPHGFSTGRSAAQMPGTLCSRVPHWTGDALAWLADMFGDFGDGELSEPRCRKHVTGDYDDFLSNEATYGYVRAHGGAHPSMDPFFAWVEAHCVEIAKRVGPAAYRMTCLGGIEGFYRIMDNRTLRELLSNTDLGEENIAKIDAALKKIPNGT